MQIISIGKYLLLTALNRTLTDGHGHSLRYLEHGKNSKEQKSQRAGCFGMEASLAVTSLPPLAETPEPSADGDCHTSSGDTGSAVPACPAHPDTCPAPPTRFKLGINLRLPAESAPKPPYLEFNVRKQCRRDTSGFVSPLTVLTVLLEGNIQLLPAAPGEGGFSSRVVLMLAGETAPIIRLPWEKPELALSICCGGEVRAAVGRVCVPGVGRSSRHPLPAPCSAGHLLCFPPKHSEIQLQNPLRLPTLTPQTSPTAAGPPRQPRPRPAAGRGDTGWDLGPWEPAVSQDSPWPPSSRVSPSHGHLPPGCHPLLLISAWVAQPPALREGKVVSSQVLGAAQDPALGCGMS